MTCVLASALFVLALVCLPSAYSDVNADSDVNAGSCVTKPLKTVNSDATKPTYIYSYTSHSELMPNPVPVIKKNCAHSVYDPKNQNTYCLAYQKYMNATNSTLKQILKSNLSNLLSPPIMGGNGFYFAADAEVSKGWGGYLLILQVPPKKSFPFYLGNDPVHTVQTVLTNGDAVLYNWGKGHHMWVLVVRDYHAFTFPDGSIKAAIINMSELPVEFFSHKVKYTTYDPVSYLSTFRDVYMRNPPSTVKVLPGGHDISDADLVKVIGWEWQLGCNMSANAVKKLNDPTITGQSVNNAVTANSFSGQWPQLLKVLKMATYLPPTANVTSGDFTGLNAALVKTYRARGGAKVVTSFYTGTSNMRNQTPNIHSWFRG